MQYRKFGKIEEEISILGFGCMRFPQLNGKIDEEETSKMIKYAIDNGVNYIDTAYPYHNGESELVIGKILKDGYREKVKLATKLPSWDIKTKEDMYRILDEQLKKLQTDYIDFYLVHALDKSLWDNLVKNNIFDFLDDIKKSRKVKHIGFSFHDNLDVFKEIVDAYDWEFTQIQYNYLDEDYQAGTKGLEYAQSKGLGIIIMEPLRGGKLVNGLSNDILDIINESSTKKSAASWAFRFLYDREDIGIVLSGMSTMEQVIDNIRICDEEGKANTMTEDEKITIEKLKDTFKSKIKINCTGCGYCMPCPSGVDIPMCFELLNSGYMFNSIKHIKNGIYNHLRNENKDASKCLECGNCESACPQHIEIIDKLKEVKETFK